MGPWVLSLSNTHTHSPTHTHTMFPIASCRFRTNSCSSHRPNREKRRLLVMDKSLDFGVLFPQAWSPFRWKSDSSDHQFNVMLECLGTGLAIRGISRKGLGSFEK